MPWGISLRIETGESRQVVRDRLAATIAPVPSARLRPIRISGWLSSYKGKLFIGSLQGQTFKLGLINKQWSGVRWRGNAVVIVGTIEDNMVRALLRPPIFTLLFSLFWMVALSTGFVLSFYGSSNTISVHLLLAAMLIFPLVVLTWTFLYEANLAEQALRNALGIAIAEDSK